MKRTLSLALALFALLTLCACGGAENAPANELRQQETTLSAETGCIVGLRSDGTVVATGVDNMEGQCNVDDWTNIVAVATDAQ